MNLEGKKITLIFTTSNYIINLDKTIAELALPMILFPVEITEIFRLESSKKLYLFWNYGTY